MMWLKSFILPFLLFSIKVWAIPETEINQLLYERKGEESLELIEQTIKESGTTPLLELKRVFAINLKTGVVEPSWLLHFDSHELNPLSEENFLYSYLCGIYALEQNRSEQATALFFKALEILKYSKGLPAYARLREVNCYAFLSHIFHTIGDDLSAEKYLLLQYDKAKAFNDSIQITMTANNLGILLKNKGEYDKAFFMYQEALSISKALNDEVGVVKALNNLAVLDETAKDSLSETSFALYQEAQDRAEEYDVLNVNASVLLMKKGDYQTALTHYESQMLEALSANDLNRLETTVLGIAACYDSLGNDRKSKESYQFYFSFRNELRSRILAEKTKEIEAKYNLFEKEYEIKQLRKERELQLARDREKSLIFWIVIIFISMALIITLLLSQRRLLIARIKQEKTENQLLRSQMNPHFIFNTLSVIQSLVQTEKLDKAVFAIGKFAALNRKVLLNSRKKNISLVEETTILTDFLDLQKIRFQDLIDYEIDLGIENAEQIFIPPNLLQPLVENAIKHGVLPKKKKGKVKLRFYSKDNLLICEVEDDGVGYNSSVKIEKISGDDDTNSMALSILRGRLTFLEKEYSTPTKMQITELRSGDSVTGTLVKLYLPLIRKDD